MVSETGSGMDDKRRKLNRPLADPTVGTIVVEHRDRLARLYGRRAARNKAKAALKAAHDA